MSLPIYLLFVPAMKVVDRETVQRQVRLSIADMLPWWEIEEIKKEAKKDMQYAILSHRWYPRSAELTFQDLQRLHKHHPDHLKELPTTGRGEHLDCDSYPKARKKLQRFCDIATYYKCKYAWVDTCCIDRKSSAELEESIRSMFHWYQQSRICIVHLRETTRPRDLESEHWFKRGWTLQELLAPEAIKFFDKEWRPLTPFDNEKDACAREERNCKLLWDEIAGITNIPKDHLFHFQPGRISIRDKMVWASRRQTSRIEDKAYCLIGIFNVSLTIAYGERERAFHRLQVEIMRNSTDTGLFIWNEHQFAVNSMFAAEPGCFLPKAILSRIKIHPYICKGDEDPTFTLTNYGLRMRRRLYDTKDVMSADGEDFLSDGRKVIILGHTDEKSKHLGVVLNPSKDREARQYERVAIIIFEKKKSRSPRAIQEIFVK